MQFKAERSEYHICMDAVYAAMETGNVPGAREALASHELDAIEREQIKHNVLKDYGTGL